MPVSLGQFVKSLSDSGLMTAEEVREFLDGLPAERRPESPEDLARELVRAGKQERVMQDRRSRKVIFLAHCLLNQNAKVAGLAGWPALVKPLIDVLAEADIGIVQLPCPECEHFGLGRPTGEDTREQYDCPKYRDTCLRLCRQVVRQVEQYLDGDYQVVCILGVEGSPSCSVATVPTRKGPAPGVGVFFEILLSELHHANIEVPAIGVPEAADLSETVSQISGLL